MKKALFAMGIAAALTLGLTSCQHQTMETMDVTIRGGSNGYYGDWTALADGSLICSVQWDELDEDVVDFGSVNAYYLDGSRQHPLPYIIPVAYTETDTNGQPYDYYVGENLRFDFKYGEITFILQDLDGEAISGDLGDMTIRVVAVGD
ncbi:MAG: hypothetical protein IJU19_00100 [Bacteroidales bacterium]|nr:hypothetical protein [Bacteroidales bacterium]